jgi:tetratricopeptide (TPR) repeat protein
MLRTPIIAIFGALTLFVLLLFAKTLPSKTDKPINAEVPGETMEAIVSQAEAALTGAAKARIGLWKSKFDHADKEQKISFSDSLTKIWEENHRPEVAAWYAEQKAIQANRFELWNNAGERYYKSIRFAKNEQHPLLYQQAMHCFEKALNQQPDNLDAKTSLGACYVEGTSDPMKGIGLLREVVAKDSTHFSAQLTLAMFSVKSGQYEKAISRFNKVLQIDPAYIEAYLYLADAYEKSANRPKAIETLEKYLSLANDETIKNEVKNYINKLKNS